MRLKSSLLRFLVIVTSIIASSGFAAKVCTQPLYLESDISQALEERDAFYHSIGIDSVAFLEMRTADRRIELDTILEGNPSCWSLFLRGLTTMGDSTGESQWFAMAITATEKNIGLTWVLAQEFERCGQTFWQEKCLRKLETLFLLAGAQSAPIITQQLLYKVVYSPTGRVQSSTLNANSVWTLRFDRYAVWPHIIAAKEYMITNTAFAFAQIHEAVLKSSGSWELQLRLFRQINRWLFLIALFFISGTLAAIGIRYLPQAFHPISERLPLVYRPKTKLFLTLTLFFSFLLLGIIPFIWIFLFIVWHHLRTRDKILATISLVFLMLYPVSLKLSDMFDSCCSPDNTLVLFQKSLDEGYSSGLDSCLSAKTSANPSDYLAHTALAVCKLKQPDIAGAYPHIQVALKQERNDPVVMLTAGTSLFAAGDLNGAKNAFQQCVNLYPGYEPAYFNLGQSYFNAMETAKGMEYISHATSLNQSRVNGFIKRNDDLFSKDWPTIRQLMQPDYSPSYFWQYIFPRYSGSWETASKRFGLSFFGAELPAYCIISIILFLLLIGFDVFTRVKDNVKKIFVCKLCQTPICRKCKRGGICQDCFNATQHIRNENIRQRIMAKIQFKSQRFQALFAIILDLVFPGIGMVFKGDPAIKTVPVFLGTSLVYGSYVAINTTSLTYPGWLQASISTPLLCLLGVYNLVFVVRAVKNLIKVLRIRGE